MSRVPFQLLELSIISAQDLSSVSKNLQTYAVTWVNPNQKLRTIIDDQGHTNPTWNDKFVFRVDEKFLNSSKSVVMVEIFAVGWLRDTLVGSVRVLIHNLVPPEIRQESSRRFVALQIRRASGRPQGILNMGVSLLDNTMRSMPLTRVNSMRFNNVVDGKKAYLRRTFSDLTDLPRKQVKRNLQKVASVLSGSVVNYKQGSLVNVGGGSVVVGVNNSVVMGTNNNLVVYGGSMVNGSMCNSDVGPSPSVVAAAVAIGLYPTQLGPPPQPGSSVLEDWRVEESSMEGLKSKIERWRMDIPPKYDHKYKRLESGRKKRQMQHRRKTIGGEPGSGLFSCFGNALGCEFTIVCGSQNGSRKNKNRGGYGNSKISISDLDS